MPSLWRSGCRGISRAGISRNILQNSGSPGVSMGMQNHKPHSNIQVAFNLFAFLNGENVYAIGGVKHEIYADDETARRLLPKTVPIDALSAIREKVLAGEEMVSLEDGTPAIPGEIFRVLHHAGKAQRDTCGR